MLFLANKLLLFKKYQALITGEFNWAGKGDLGGSRLSRPLPAHHRLRAGVARHPGCMVGSGSDEHLFRASQPLKSREGWMARVVAGRRRVRQYMVTMATIDPHQSDQGTPASWSLP